MPISATGPTNNAAPAEDGFTLPRRSAEQGFTLVELMVVVTVMALAAGAVAWSLPDPAGRVHDEAARFALRVRAAHDSAITEARPVSVWVTAGGYGFEGRTGGAWVPLTRPLAVETWKPGTGATLSDATPRVRVIFDPTGAADRPLDVRLQRRAARAVVRIGGDGNVSVDG